MGRGFFYIMATKKIKTIKSEKQSACSAVLSFGNEVLKGAGETPLEAFNNFIPTVKPIVKSRATLQVEKDGKKSVVFLNVLQTKRFFVLPGYRQLLEKRLLLTLQ